MKANINCDQAAWLAYWDACSDGLQAAARSANTSLTFGGPGSGGATQTSWVLPGACRNNAKDTAHAKCSAAPIAVRLWTCRGAVSGAGPPREGGREGGRQSVSPKRCPQLALKMTCVLARRPALIKHLAARKRARGSYGCDFIQWHDKGMLPGEVDPQGRVASSCNSIVDQQIVQRWGAPSTAPAR